MSARMDENVTSSMFANMHQPMPGYSASSASRNPQPVYGNAVLPQPLYGSTASFVSTYADQPLYGDAAPTDYSYNSVLAYMERIMKFIFEHESIRWEPRTSGKRYPTSSQIESVNLVGKVVMKLIQLRQNVIRDTFKKIMSCPRGTIGFDPRNYYCETLLKDLPTFTLVKFLEFMAMMVGLALLSYRNGLKTVPDQTVIYISKILRIFIKTGEFQLNGGFVGLEKTAFRLNVYAILGL